MQGPQDDEISTQFFSPELYRLSQTSSSNSMKNQLLSFLLEQNSKIQKLLERQNLLSTNFIAHQRQQTTDSEHPDDEFEGFFNLEFSQDKSEQLKNIHLSLEHHQRQLLSFKGQIQKNTDLLKSSSSKGSPRRPIERKTQKNQKKNLLQCFDSSQNEKKIVKQFVMRLYRFCRKNTNLMSRILSELKLDHNEMNGFFKFFQKQVSDFEGLRKFWQERQHRYVKILRIMSNIYVKKRYLQQAFKYQDRMGNIYLKFRNLLIEELKKGN